MLIICMTNIICFFYYLIYGVTIDFYRNEWRNERKCQPVRKYFISHPSISNAMKTHTQRRTVVINALTPETVDPWSKCSLCHLANLTNRYHSKYASHTSVFTVETIEKYLWAYLDFIGIHHPTVNRFPAPIEISLRYFVTNLHLSVKFLLTIRYRRFGTP